MVGSRPSKRDLGASMLLGAALITPLVLIAAILLHARASERAQRELADRALAHYAAIATWQLAAHAAQDLHNLVVTRMQQPADGRRARMPSAMGWTDTSRCDCLDDVALRSRFRFDPGTGTLHVIAGTPDSATRALLSSAARGAADVTGEPHRVIFDSSAGVARAIAMFVDRNAGPIVEGFESDPEPYRRAVTRILAARPLLPPQLVPPPYTADELAVRLMTPDGFVVFASGGRFSGRHAATDTVGGIAGPLRATVEIAPALASALIIGGLPRPRTPVLIALLVLATVLAIGAFVHHRRARELVRVRTEFVASVSHELRTPLTQIAMFAETLMLERERSADERRHFASIIHRESWRLASLVDSVLRFTRGDSGRFPMRIEPRRLADEIATALASFRPIADAAEARIAATLDPPITAAIDPGAFRQIMLNLLDNAVKYGPRGQRIEVTLAQRGDDAVISVRDEGPGIPEVDRERVFEPFVRLDSPGARVAGTGIGLAVVRELVTAFGGTVTALAATTGGAKLEVRLPLATGTDARSSNGAGPPAGET